MQENTPAILRLYTRDLKSFVSQPMPLQKGIYLRHGGLYE